MCCQSGHRSTTRVITEQLHQWVRTFLRACWNMSRTREAPTPTNISINSVPAAVKNGTPASPAMAFASSVLPVPEVDLQVRRLFNCSGATTFRG